MANRTDYIAAELGKIVTQSLKKYGSKQDESLCRKFEIQPHG